MQSVQEIAEQIVAREGGFANDPDDPGGATKYGVTLGTLRRLGLAGALPACPSWALRTRTSSGRHLS